jgi:hypothetical protein
MPSVIRDCRCTVYVAELYKVLANVNAVMCTSHIARAIQLEDPYIPTAAACAVPHPQVMMAAGMGSVCTCVSSALLDPGS